MVEKGVPLRSSDFAARGINRMTLHRLVAKNELERAGNGLYRLPNKSGIFDDWAALAARYLNAVIATLSAAVFHQMTQEMPGSIHVAFPRSSGRSSLPESFPVMSKVLRWTATESYDPFSAGVEIHEIDGVQVRITSPERTVEIGKVVHFQGHSDHFGTSPMTIRIGRLISRGNFPGARSDRLARSD